MEHGQDPVSMNERETLMSVENDLIAVMCYPKEEWDRLEDARGKIRACLKRHPPCPKCWGSGWMVIDHAICLECNGSGRTNPTTLAPGAPVICSAS